MKPLAFLFAILALTAPLANRSFAQSPPRELEGMYAPWDHRIELRWHEPSSGPPPASYKVYRRTMGDSAFAPLATTADTRYNDAAIVSNTSYAYFVTSLYPGDVESMPSHAVIVSTGGGGGGGGDSVLPPRQLTGRFDDHSPKVELDWMSPGMMSHPLSYRIYRSLAPDTSFAVVGSAGETEFSDFAVAANETYRYRVTAIYSGPVESGPSNTVEVRTVADSGDDGGSGVVTFSSDPPRLAFVNQPYSYDADVTTNPPGLPVTFELHQAPPGMLIDPSTGLVSWTPAFMGAFEVEIRARTTGSPEGEAEQEFHLFVMGGSPGRVEGTVRNAGGDGLPGVRIRLFDVVHGSFVLRTSTDGSGHYEFPFVNPATYLVRARPENELYRAQWFDGAAEMADATPVSVAESASVTVNFTLLAHDTSSARFTLSGNVADTGSAPIAGAGVSVFSIDDDGESHHESGDDHNHGRHHEGRMTVFTDANGDYSVTLRTGVYVVRAEAEGYFAQYWDHRSSPFEADPVSLDMNTPGISFNLMPRVLPNGSISGTVRSAADSAGLRSLIVGFRLDDSSRSDDHRRFSSTYSDSAGNYTLSHLEDGDYLVLAVPGEDFEPTFYSTTGGTHFKDSATAVTVAGAAVAGIDIYAQPDSDDGLNTIAGIVTSGSAGGGADIASAPEAGAIVTIADARTRRSVTTTISLQDGSYMTSGLAPGSYIVVFQKPGKATAGVPVVVSYANNMPTVTTVDAQLQDAGAGRLGLMVMRRLWNLVSVPVEVGDLHRTAIFPTASTDAFRFNAAGGYQTSPVLEYGSGYWMKFPSAQVLSLAGAERTNQTVALAPGWNLVGSVSRPVPASAVVADPPGLIASAFFGYSGGYASAATLEPGSGYWIKASGAGTITMLSAGAPQGTAAPPSRPFEGMNSLTVTDAAGNSQVLYFGKADKSFDAASTELPPVPPGGAFDVRFGSGRFAETHAAPERRPFEAPIEIRSAAGPLTVSWIVRDENVAYALADAKGRPLGAGLAPGSGSTRITSGGITRLLLTGQPRHVPQAYALGQNFPNPFNPATTISFSLPAAARVDLKVYNILGQEVASLLSRGELAAGEQSVRFDASSFPSGVYFYRLTAAPLAGGTASFSAVKRMMLLK